jgi:O-antigen/teichoic acid export membrane protein
VGSPFISRFFNEPQVIVLIRIISLSEVFKGLTHIGIINFDKKLDFSSSFLFQISGIIMDLIVSVTLSIILKSPLALALGLVSGNFVRLVISHLLMKKRLKIKIKTKYFKFFSSFGLWLFLAAIFNFLAVQGDDIYVGKVIGTTALGIYQLSYKICNTFAKELVSIFSTVIFPSLSLVKNNFERLRRHFFKYLLYLSAASLVLGLTLYLIFPYFVKHYLDEQWISLIPIGKILIIGGLFRSFSSIYGALYLSLGKTKIKFIKQLIRTLITFFPFFIYRNINLVQISWFVVFGNIGAFMIDLIQTFLIFKRKK